MLIIGCDFHPGFQQVAIFDKRTGEIEEKRLQHREEAEPFYQSLSEQQVRVGMEACGHYPWFEQWLAEVGIELWFGDAAKVRAAVVRRQKTDRRDAEHVLQLLLENRFPKIWVPSRGGAGGAAVAGASAQTGAGADTHQEPAASHGAEPGGAEKVEAVDESRAGGVGAVAAAALHGPEETTVAAGAGRAGSRDRRTGPASGGRSAATAGSGAADDASGSGAGDGAGHGADAGTGGTIRIGQASGQLFWPDSERRIQRRETTAGQDQPTGQFVSALFAGGSGTGATGSATEALLQTPGDAQESQHRQGGRGQKIGHAVVPDVARGLDVCATESGRHAGEPESSCGRAEQTDRLSGQPASLKSQGVRSEKSWVQVPKRWMVGLRSTARLKSKDDLGLGVKDFLRERNGASSGVDAEVSPQNA